MKALIFILFLILLTSCGPNREETCRIETNNSRDPCAYSQCIMENTIHTDNFFAHAQVSFLTCKLAERGK